MQTSGDPAPGAGGARTADTRIDVPVTYNFRPVQGTRGLYRSDALARLRRGGREKLRDLGVARVIDMRSGVDRLLGGSDRLRGVGAELVRIPIVTGGTRSQLDRLSLHQIYRQLLDERQAELARVLRAVAGAPEGAVVIHCTAGKDRSGIAAALVQLGIGVPVDTVVADYEVTERYLEGEWAERTLRRMRHLRVPVTPQLREVLVGSPAQAVEDALDHLDSTYGGADAYLAAIGIDAPTVEHLRSRLLR